MADAKQSSGGITLVGATFIVFLVLKLTGNIDWSWWWVTCPLWAMPALAIGVVAVMFVVAFAIAFVQRLFA